MNGHNFRVSLAGPGKQLTHITKRKMKKLNLEKLKLAAEDVLQRNQMTTVYGGSDCGYFHCQCSGSVGTWQATYCSVQDMVNAIQYWCASGEGNCTPASG